MEQVSPIFIAFCLCFSFFLGAAVTLSAVALGGYLVFRTKKEPHESFFEKERQAGAFIVDEFAQATQPLTVPRRPIFGEPRSTSADVDPVPDIMDKQTDKFLRILAEKKAKETNG